MGNLIYVSITDQEGLGSSLLILSQPCTPLTLQTPALGNTDITDDSETLVILHSGEGVHNTPNVFNSGVIRALGQRTLHRKCWNSFGGVLMLTGKDTDCGTGGYPVVLFSFFLCDAKHGFNVYVTTVQTSTGTASHEFLCMCHVIRVVLFYCYVKGCKAFTGYCSNRLPILKPSAFWDTKSKIMDDRVMQDDHLV